MTAKPNLVLIVTDQERPPMDWPAGNAERCLPWRARLPKHGVSFEQAADPSELDNLAHPDHPRYSDPEVVAERSRLADKLAATEARLARPLTA